MPIDLVYRILYECHEIGISNVALGATGEPLLHKHYFDLLERAKSLGLWVSITSNCSLLTPEKTDDILKIGMDRFNISIYSATEAEHRNYTGTDTFDQTVENIRYLLIKWHETKSSMELNMWFLPISEVNSYEKYKQFWEPLCDRIGIRLPIKPMINWSGRIDTSANKTNSTFWIDKIPSHIRICRKHRIRCEHIRYYLQVLHTGEVVPCCVIPEIKNDKEVLFGNVINDSLMSIWKSQKYLAFKNDMYRRKFYSYRPCKSCSETFKTSCIHFPPIGLNQQSA